MKVLTYEIKLLEPALITALAGDPNSSIALNYLPGSILRGAIIQKYIQQQKKDNPAYQFDPTDKTIRSLFFDGQTRFLNGYLLDNGQRSLPVPLSWQCKKAETDTSIYDFAYEDASVAFPDKTWQGISQPFCIVADGTVQLLKLKQLTTVHITRDRHIGHQATEKSEQRSIYRYISLTSGQTFSAAIICSTEQQASILKPLLQEETWIGGSRTAGYGRVEFCHTTTIEPSDKWREFPTELEEGDEQFSITFVSDALIRDLKSGQYTVDSETIVEFIQDLFGNVQLREAFLETVPIGGFNRKWGLPLPQVMAVKMGSVFVFDIQENVDKDKLRRLEQNGLGERRVEGFGRVLINWHDRSELTTPTDNGSSSKIPLKIAEDTTVAPIVRNMVNRLLEEQLELLVAKEAEKLSNQVKGIRRSQLNRLRMVIQNEMFADIPRKQGRFQKYLTQLNERPVTRKQFDKARLAGKPLIEWLKLCFSSEGLVAGSISPMPKIGDMKAELTPEIVHDYNLRLAEAVLAQAAKKAGDE